MSKLISCAEAAQIIGVSAHEVRRLIRAGRLKAQRIGRDWIISATVAKTFRRGQRGVPCGVSGR